MTTHPTATAVPATAPAGAADTDVDPVGWEPNRTVFCSLIFAEAPGASRQQIAATRWASLAEARGYIERRMPTVSQVRPDETVTAFVVPAETHVRMRDGELVQDVVPHWGGAQRAHLNSRGYVTW